ncbi:MAG: C40 family peptidase [Candidatus Sericytochromatia bacterium]
MDLKKIFIYTTAIILSTNLSINSNNIFNTSIFNMNIAKAAEEDLNQLLNQIKERVAKDSRINLFDIKAERKNDQIILSGRVIDPNLKKEILEAFKTYSNIKDEIQIFPFSEIGDLSYGVVNLPVMQIRDNPRHSAQLITQALFGMGLKVIGKSQEKPDWIQVSMDDDKYIGWAKKADIWFINKKEYDNWFSSDKIIITEPIINLLNTPNENDKSGIKLFLSTRLNNIDKNSNFYKVKLTGGNKYYSNHYFYIPKNSARFIGKNLLPLNIKGEDLWKKGQTMFSTPYLWGGASPNMTDCSGFTQMLYKTHGYMLPRDADQQQEFTKPIKTISELKSGDLVFFAENKGKKATHVGLYMGDKKFIHSSVGYGGVAITSFDSKDPLFNDWYIENFIGGGRILK